MNNINVFMHEAVRAFRLGIICEGNDALTKFIDGIVAIIESSTSTLSEVDILIMKELLSAQERGDFNYVADILEYEFTQSSMGKLMQK